MFVRKDENKKVTMDGPFFKKNYRIQSCQTGDLPYSDNFPHKMLRKMLTSLKFGVNRNF